MYNANQTYHFYIKFSVYLRILTHCLGNSLSVGKSLCNILHYFQPLVFLSEETDLYRQNARSA